MTKVLRLLPVLLLSQIAMAYGSPGRANAPVGQTPAPAAPRRPQLSSAMLTAFARADRWALAGNFTQAIRILKTFAESPAATPYDRYKVTGSLAAYYRSIGDLPATISANKSILASRFFATDYNTAPLLGEARRYALLQIARDELSLGNFTAAEADAGEVLSLLHATGAFPLISDHDVEATARQIQQRAMQRNTIGPAPAVFHAPLPPLIGPDPKIAPQRRALACTEVLAHANAGSLAGLGVWAAPAPNGAGSLADSALPLANATRLDLFGNGVPVYIMTVRPFANTRLELLDAHGMPMRLKGSSTTNWDRIEDEGADESLIKVAGHFYILGEVSGQPVYVLAVAENRVEEVICEFTTAGATDAGEPQVRAMTPFERLAADAAYEGPDRSPTDYVLGRPGTEATATLLDAVRNHPPSATASDVSPSLYDGGGRSILMLAITFGRDDIVSYLLDHGVDPSLGDDPGGFGTAAVRNTPLEEAVYRDDLSATALLLEHRAAPSARAVGTAFQHGPVAMFRLLLAHGGNPNFGPTDISDLIERKPDAQDLATKIDISLRAGADPDVWVHSLFNAVANRSGLAPARTLLEREGRCLPESARYVPVRTAWVNALLSNPTRARDNGLEPLLREATQLRDAARSTPSSHPEPERCAGAAEVRPATIAAESPIPLRTRDSFLAYAAAMLLRRLPPGYSVKPDLGMASVLIMDDEGAKIGHLSIEEQYQWCQATPQSCFWYVSRWAFAAQDAVSQFAAPPDRRSLILMVGPRSLFESELAPRAASAPAVLMRPCLPELVCAIAAEVAGGLRFLNAHDLAVMNLSEDAAFGIATTNVQQSLAASLTLPLLSADHPIQFINYDAYDSSLLLLHSEWTSLARETGGHLIAAVPATDLVVYSTDVSAGSVAALRKFVAACMPSARRPLSPSIFRWQPNGWQLIQ